MHAPRLNAPGSPYDSIGSLLDLARRARHAADALELAFLLVNDTHALAPYRQSALWFADTGVRALSGVVQIEANAPYAQWLNRVCRSLGAAEPRAITAADLPDEASREWSEWLPTHALWLPIVAPDGVLAAGGLLIARDTEFTRHEIALLAEWIDTWRHAYRAKFQPPLWSTSHLKSKALSQLRWKENISWWKQRPVQWAAGVVALMLMPVRLTVLAPGELVPANPTVIRAPLDGVIGTFFVRPNEEVKVGQALFNFDDAPLVSRVAVAAQALATAGAEYRQAAQLAVSENKSKAQLALLAGKIEERKAEADYLRGQFERSHVVAPTAGIALFDDPSEWIGKPVVTGERIMRIAAPDDVEVEAWLGVGDAIPIAPGATAKLYLNASPLFAVTANVRYVSHDAVQRADGTYAYRVRATLDGKTDHRVGLKGTAKVSGGWVPAIYWVLRRPVAAIRQTLGW
jgi:HlyD family secretion protein